MSDDIRIARNDDADRYEILVDGRVAGFTEYEADAEGRHVFPHTEIDPAYGGRGLGTKLVAAAMEGEAARGVSVVPVCPSSCDTCRRTRCPASPWRGARVTSRRRPTRRRPSRRRATKESGRPEDDQARRRGPRPGRTGRLRRSPRAAARGPRGPLGGVRAMEVHRSLPQRALPMVGAWCFLDRFGPQTARMRVEPHPHIGLQTVTWPLVGEVRHRDTLGNDVVVRRGVLNLMTSGAGIAHSEYSLGEDAVPLDALQLWVALPESRRHGAAEFERHENLPIVTLDDGRSGATATVVVGDFAGVPSPATMHTPIVGAEIHVPAGSRVRLRSIRPGSTPSSASPGCEVHTAEDAATALPDQGCCTSASIETGSRSARSETRHCS
jgi:predicted GNAT family acetyltransferase